MAPDDESTPAAEPGSRDAVVDLLGALAYGELTAFSRLAGDAELAPSLRDKVALAQVAAVELRHYEQLAERIGELGGDPHDAMAPFVAPVDAFHDRTAPNDWLEGLVKAYVGDGVAMDFYREVAAYVDTDTRALVETVLADQGHTDVVAAAVRGAVERDARLAGRLALWARRLVGEALSQAQRVAVDRDGLAGLLVGTETAPGADLAEIGRMFARIMERHGERMARLGLAP
ncbi:ferritin-like fold-containing protein [Aquipuribacter nitratireducens]|uniref:Ferritin-like fold-containing protein n=1 Tax=Aquipuribacter nitratireducens TaxID=650104 RepID=A0ABW0GLT6_9MICO